MKLLRLCLPISVVLLAAACERAKRPTPIDSASATGAAVPNSTVAQPPASQWDSDAGPVLLIAGDSPTNASVIPPDSAAAGSELASIPHPASVTLLGRGGTVQTADLAELGDTSACAVATLDAAPPPRPWSIGVIGGVVSPIGMDSAESLSPADSVSLVAGVTRLASALPNDSAGRFTGLTFVVHAIWRFSLPNGNQVVVANLAREINQEATPLQERTLLIAERTAMDTTLYTGYSERAYGTEESVESYEVLLSALLGVAHTPTLFISRDYGDSIAYDLVERDANGHWRTRWSSRRRTC